MTFFNLGQIPAYSLVPGNLLAMSTMTYCKPRYCHAHANISHSLGITLHAMLATEGVQLHSLASEDLDTPDYVLIQAKSRARVCAVASREP